MRFEDKLIGFSFLISAYLIVGCSKEDDPIPETITIEKPGSISIRDISNYGDARDIEFDFVKPGDLENIKEFRVFIVANTEKNSFDSITALNQNNNYLTITKSAESEQVRLAANTTAIDGSAIKEGSIYNIFVLSVASDAELGGALSSPSSDFALAQRSAVSTLTDVIIAGTGGMDVDQEGNIYMADFGETTGGPAGTKVFKITPSGAVSLFASGLNGASGNDFDNEGNLYQSNIFGGSISKITPDGTVSTFATGLSGPVGIAFDGSSNFYVCNCGNNTIAKVDMDGNVSIFSSGSLFNCPNGIDIDSDGNLYVANFSSSTLVKIDPAGKAVGFATTPHANNGHLLINGDFIYVISRGTHQILRVGFTGNVGVFAGSGNRGRGNGNLTQATFSFPNDLAFSSDGTKMYINDVAGDNPSTTLITPVIIRVIDIVN